MRDPKFNPKPGDVLRGRSRNGDSQTRRVTSVIGGIVYFTTFTTEYAQPQGVKRNSLIGAWRKWAANAMVVRIGVAE